MLDFPADYPFKPPVVAFKTRIFHPSVVDDDSKERGKVRDVLASTTGHICFYPAQPSSTSPHHVQVCIGLLLPDQWKPAVKVQQSMLMRVLFYQWVSFLDLFSLSSSLNENLTTSFEAFVDFTDSPCSFGESAGAHQRAQRRASRQQGGCLR